MRNATGVYDFISDSAIYEAKADVLFAVSNSKS